MRALIPSTSIDFGFPAGPTRIPTLADPVVRAILASGGYEGIGKLEMQPGTSSVSLAKLHATQQNEIAVFGSTSADLRLRRLPRTDRRDSRDRRVCNCICSNFPDRSAPRSPDTDPRY
jgi:hypothetical protein